jgi:hypothetical protein
MITYEQLNYIYQAFRDKVLATVEAQNNSEFKVDLIDIGIKIPEEKSTTVLVNMEFAGGSETMPNYVPFGPGDYWYWGWGLGKCSSYQGIGIGQDAAEQLEFKINHPRAVREPGFFTDNVIITVFPDEFEDPSGNYEFMIFVASGEGENPVEEPCLSPDQLNYYLNKFEYIKSTMQPTGKTFIKINVIEDIIPADNSWCRLHIYDLYYGIFTPGNAN